MLNYILGGSGYGKSTELINKIISEYETGKKIYILVPEQFSFEFDKKLYNSIGVEKYNNVNSVTFTTLSREIFQSIGSRAGDYASDMAKTVLMYRAIKRVKDNGWLTYFKKNSMNTAFIEQAASVVYELRKSGITPAFFIDKTTYMNAQLRDKIKDISLIYSEYDNMLAENNLRDSLTDISEAAAAANINDYFKDTVFIIDEFENFTGDEYEMLDVIIAQSYNVYIALRTDSIKISQFSLFETVNKTFAGLNYIVQKYSDEYSINILDNAYRFNNKELSHIERNILRNNRKIFNNKISENAVKIIETKNLYQETEYVCAEIRRLIIEKCYCYNDIAIVSRRIKDYIGIFESAFERYEIPYFMDVKKSAMNTSMMVLIVTVMEIISRNSPNTDLILKYAKTQLTGISYQKISKLENYCFKWNIDGETWLEAFTFEKNDEVEETRIKLISPLIKLKNSIKNATGYVICRELYTFLEEINVPKNVSGLAQSYKKNGYTYMAKEVKMLWGSLMDMLDVLSEILKDEVIEIESFKNIFLLMLKHKNYSVPPQSLDAVTVASAETARLNSPKVTFVIGVNDGVFPSVEKSKGIISDSEKELLEDVGIKLSRTAKDIIADERFIVYKTLSSASERLYLLYPLADNTGIGRYPSFIIDQVENMFSFNIKNYAENMGASYYSSTLKSAYYTYVQGYNKSDIEFHSVRQVLSENKEYDEKLRFLDMVNKNSDFFIQDKSLVKDLFTENLRVSASNFESYNKCHFKFFCENGLKIHVRTKKDINSLEKGNMVHYCLEKILSPCKTKEEFDRLTRGDINEYALKFSKEYKDSVLGGDTGKSQRFQAAFQKTVESMTELICHIQDEFRQSKFVPVNYELKIDEGKGNAPIRLITSKGIEIILSGKIDRVDMYESNGEKYIRVIDYKTGKKDFSLKNIVYGLDMQMLLYLFALIEESGMYSGAKPAGVLYMPSGALKCDGDRGRFIDVSDKINSQYKMKGVILKDRMILQAMEEEIQGIYIPAKALSDKGESALDKRPSVLSGKQFYNIKEYMKKLMIDMAEDLYDGKISANPLILSDSNVCDYCDYWDVCGNMPNVRSRMVTYDNELLNEILSEESEN